MLLLIGASASGKTEIAKLLINRYHMEKLVTYTTRPKRSGEIHGKDYYFLDYSDFKEKEKNGFFLETSTYQGNWYGTSFSNASENSVLIVDPDGANAIYRALNEEVVIYLIETPRDLRRARMIIRGDDEEIIESRLSSDDAYFNQSRLFHIDNVFENSHQSLEKLADTIYSAYIKKRLNSN